MEQFSPRPGVPLPIPVTVLTGFLGAGKTTLLNRILRGDHGSRVAVMVNDFGAINIDQSLVVGVDEKVISLANGCICCEINDDLITSISGLMEMSPRPEYILVEASGVADPSGIAMTLTLPQLRQQIRLDTVTSLIDAANVFAQPELQRLKLRQIAFSDLLILNKIDLVDEPELARIKAWIAQHFGSVRLIETTFAEVPLEILLSVGRFDLTSIPREQKPENVHREKAHQHFATFCYTADGAFDARKLERIMSRLPPSIYRVKGIVAIADAPGIKSVLQVVGRRVDISRAKPWGDTSPSNRVVAIGAPDALDEEQLRRKLDACLMAPVSANG